MDDDEEATSSSLKAYCDLLRDNRAFTIVWIGEVCSATIFDAACLQGIKAMLYNFAFVSRS